MMKALIIEDETAAARNLAAILRQTAPDVEIVATLESVEESDGSTLRSISGVMIETRICIGVSPIARPASPSPFGMESRPAR